jgi:glyoxylase-like metal-dependent hydrolase (beta-lactamase superfamily II)
MTEGVDYGSIVKPIGDKIFNIDIPIPHDLKNFNLYLLLGREPTLIDSGPYHPALEQVVTGCLAYLGVRRLSKILITHSHMDHYGMAGKVRSLTGGKILAHELERERLEGGGEYMAREYEGYATLGGAFGFPREMLVRVFETMRPWLDMIEPCTLDGVVRDGDVIQAGDIELVAIHTPGHTAGHLCYLDKEDCLLFSGDHLMRTITPNPELYWPARNGRLTGLGQFIESLELLKPYDIARAFPGHGQPIKQVARRIRFTLLHHEKRLESTREAVDEGRSTVWEVAQKLFPQVPEQPPGVDYFLALKEALGHLVILEEQGRVRREDEGELLRFFPAA